MGQGSSQDTSHTMKTTVSSASCGDQTWQEVASVKDRTCSGYGPCGEKAWGLGSIPSTDTKQNPAKACISKYRAKLPLRGLSMDSYIHTVLFVLKNLKWLKDLIIA